MLETLPFLDEGDTPLHTPLGVGLDGRLFTDLSLLNAAALITPNERFYVRTRYPDQLDPAAPWRVRIGGLVGSELELDLDWFLERESFLGTHLLECSGNSQGGALRPAQRGRLARRVRCATCFRSSPFAPKPPASWSLVSTSTPSPR